MRPVSDGMPAPWLPLGARVRNLAFRLSKAEASFERRGFPGQSSPDRRHLESIIETFVTGYNLALETPDDSELTSRLDDVTTTPYLGFAYEGVGLWLAISDLFRPWIATSRLAHFTKNVAPRHDFIAMVGAGFAVARMPFGVRRLQKYQERLDPMTAWCIADGVGFHDGFFHWQKYRTGQLDPPAFLNPQNRALFDAGLGRSFWWVYGADCEAIAAAIERFAPARRAEMWTGIGTALVYAGPSQPSARLLALSGSHRVDLLIGVALGANMRDKGGNPSSWTDQVCATLMNGSVAEVSSIVETELAAYLDSWNGDVATLRDGCYLALRARLAARLDAEGRA
jgi:hypothetical protein